MAKKPMREYMEPNPGMLPTKPAPNPGDEITIRVDGLPPYKGAHQSLRNVSHPNYPAFVRLRDAATVAMDGRRWYDRPVHLALRFHINSPENQEPRRNTYGDFYNPVAETRWSGIEYFGGVADTLDGSHGFTFTYLPIVYQDDCQVRGIVIETIFQTDDPTYYEVVATFMPPEEGSPG